MCPDNLFFIAQCTSVDRYADMVNLNISFRRTLSISIKLTVRQILIFKLKKIIWGSINFCVPSQKCIKI